MDIDRDNLYKRWRKIILQPHDAIFDSFETFYWWAMATRYQIGARLVLKDANGCYSPENCEWKIEKNERITDESREQIAKWNRTVNVIRRAHGLPLFEEDPAAI